MTDAERRLLAANAAFYEAFASGDYGRLEALWARDRAVAVIHPGWPPIFGREAVLQSWRQILEGPAPPDIAMSDARSLGPGDLGCVICVEHLPGGQLVATNLFALEEGEWRLVHHQAGPLPPGAEPEPSERVH